MDKSRFYSKQLFKKVLQSKDGQIDLSNKEVSVDDYQDLYHKEVLDIQQKSQLDAYDSVYQDAQKEEKDIIFGQSIDSEPMVDGENFVERGNFVDTLVITGDISVETPCTLAGKILGNVVSTEEITTKPGILVQGDIIAKTLSLSSGTIEGNIDCRQDILISTNSVVKGDLSGESIEVAGEVVGNVVATKNIVVRNSARIIGKLMSEVLSIDKGAILDIEYTNTTLK